MCLAQGPQGSDTGEAQTCDLLVSSQALYHWDTALPDTLMRANNKETSLHLCCPKATKSGFLVTRPKIINKHTLFSISVCDFAQLEQVSF